jgi:hypothetical protein
MKMKGSLESDNDKLKHIGPPWRRVALRAKRTPQLFFLLQNKQFNRPLLLSA